MKPLNLVALDLNWKLAVKRLRQDVQDDFWPDPFRYEDLLRSCARDLASVSSVLEDFQPRRGTPSAIPKANLTIRDSIQLTGLDRLVYQALADKLSAALDPCLCPRVFSHRLRSPDHKFMFHSGVQRWKSFLDAVKTALRDQPQAYLVITDVTHYFEAIRYSVLRKQLENVIGETQRSDLLPCANALMSCLYAWSPYNGYGLAQNIDASSFLGNILLDGVDRLMEREGFPMFRYMDDIRIVVPTEADARIALMKLVAHLRDLGLGLNAAKTELLAPGSAEMERHLRDEDPEIASIEKAVGEKTQEAAQNIVDILFGKTERLIETRQVGERSFRFCLNRIVSFRRYKNLRLPDGSDITDSVLKLLVTRPAETLTFCSYLEVAPFEERHTSELCRLLISEPLLVYSWQKYHLWRIAAQRKVKHGDLARRAHEVISADPNDPAAAGASLYLGSQGDYADRQVIGKAVQFLSSALSCRCFRVGAQELHPSERSRAYESGSPDTENGILGDHIQSLNEPVYAAHPAEIGIDELPDTMPSVYA